MGNQVDLLWEEPCGRVSPLGEDLALCLGDHSTRRMGRLASVVVGEDPPFGSEARDAFGLRTNGAGGEASPQSTKKSSKIDL